MLSNIKALFVVLTVAILVFMIAKPVCLRFMTEDDFVRRRNVWVVLTITAFSSPSFWLYVLVAMPLLIWATNKDQNPLALYFLLLYVIPPIGQQIPTIGINQLFELDSFRILAISILIPAALRFRQSENLHDARVVTTTDKLILAYIALQLVLLMPYESITHTMRRGFLMSIDTLLVYYVASRAAGTTPRILTEALACLCLASIILAPLALFETLWRWLLYTGIGTHWGNLLRFAYLFRDNTLRAQVSTGHSLTLGYTIAIAFGFWLYLSIRFRSTLLTTFVAIWLWVGLLAAYSRAPWIVAVLFLFIFLALGPKAPSRIMSALLISVVIAAMVLISPIGDRIIDSLPFVGTVDQRNVLYRQRLAEVSWELIQQNPLFGNPFFLTQMEELRQGQGIIDLLNHYATVALLYGFAGLSLFVAPLFINIWHAYRLIRKSAATDPELSMLGASITACFIASLFMIATAGIGNGQVFYSLLGIIAGYARLSSPEPAHHPREHKLAKFGH